jgi:hypothetical protein
MAVPINSAMNGFIFWIGLNWVMGEIYASLMKCKY